MSKKLSFWLWIFLTAILSVCVGVYFGTTLFKRAFVVCECDGSISTYCLERGKIVSSSAGIIGEKSINPLEHVMKIDLVGKRNNNEAIKEIEKQVSAQGGHVISVAQ